MWDKQYFSPSEGAEAALAHHAARVAYAFATAYPHAVTWCVRTSVARRTKWWGWF